MPDYIKVIEHQVTKIALQFSDFLSEKDIAYIQEGVSNSIHGVIDWCVNFASGLLSKGFVVANILSLIIITPIVAIFFLKDWPRFVEELDLLMPKRYRSIIRQLCTEMNQKLSFFVRGQAVIAFILMMYYTVSLSILKLEGALLIGIVAGLFSFIPYFAVSFGFIMSLFSGFLGNFEFMGYMGILGVFIIGSMLEGAILSPLLIGNSVGLHPLWIVFSVMSGAKIVGFMGVIIAVPTAAIVGVLIRFGIRKYLESSYYRK
jgi:predicted PurR-regulated permease PerM